jgi:hypothetical protein
MQQEEIIKLSYTPEVQFLTSRLLVISAAAVAAAAAVGSIIGGGGNCHDSLSIQGICKDKSQHVIYIYMQLFAVPLLLSRYVE